MLFRPVEDKPSSETRLPLVAISGLGVSPVNFGQVAISRIMSTTSRTTGCSSVNAGKFVPLCGVIASEGQDRKS